MMDLFNQYTKISDIVNQLENIKNQHGDLKVTTQRLRGGVVDFEIANIRVTFIKKPDKKERIAYYTDNPANAKEKVVSI